MGRGCWRRAGRARAQAVLLSKRNRARRKAPRVAAGLRAEGVRLVWIVAAQQGGDERRPDDDVVVDADIPVRIRNGYAAGTCGHGIEGDGQPQRGKEGWGIRLDWTERAHHSLADSANAARCTASALQLSAAAVPASSRQPRAASTARWAVTCP